MKKEESMKTQDNSFGIASVIFGVLGLVSIGGQGIVLGIVGIIFSLQQRKRMANNWSKIGLILSILAVVISIILLIVMFTILYNNPELASRLGGYT